MRTLSGLSLGLLLALLPTSAREPGLGPGPLLGAPPAAAQEPKLWRDPDQGCTYVVTPQGGVGLHYRADGSPDCPDARDPVTTRSTGQAPSRAPPADGSRRVGARARAVQSEATALAPPPVGSLAAADPVATGSLGRPERGEPPRRPGLAFTCRPAEGSTRDVAPAAVRVQVEPEARVMLVEASGALQRYTLDTTWDVWFNGRSERDPRLGIILSASRGSMWLDLPTRAGLRQEVRSLPFACEAEGSAD